MKNILVLVTVILITGCQMSESSNLVFEKSKQEIFLTEADFEKMVGKKDLQKHFRSLLMKIEF